MRPTGKIYYTILIFLLSISCNHEEKKPASIEIKKINYPSASSVEYYNGKLCVMGDDATDLLVLDTNLNILDSTPIISYPARRIPKDVKPDIEASAFINTKGQQVLYLFGSGSLSPQRDSLFLWFPGIKLVKRLSFGDLYEQLKNTALEQINIEGACFIVDNLILANRGNKSYPFNHLVIVDTNFWKTNNEHNVKVIQLQRQPDTASFKGVSGLCYSKQNDRLIMTVSTEDTRSAHEDGPIGKSYLWIIENISTKLNSMSISPDKIIDLETIDPRFKGQKIESATVIEERNDFIRLVLVADNDDGSSTIFKMNLNLRLNL
jgi:hypothetical protein